MGISGAYARRLSRVRLEEGFTLVELLVVMLIGSILMSISVSGWTSYQRSIAGVGSRDEVLSTLRNAQQAAYADGIAYCVRFDAAASTYYTYEAFCGTGTLIGKPHQLSSVRVHFSSAAFTQSDGSVISDVTFTPRGTASPGQVVIIRDSSNTKYQIKVEGLTGRVSSQ